MLSKVEASKFKMQNYNSKFKIKYSKLKTSYFILHTSYFNLGQSLVEILIVIGLMAILIPALFTGLYASREGKAQDAQRSEALAYLKETVEAIRTFRENGWSNFSGNGTFHPQVSGTSWTLVAGPESINGFTRSVVINDVNRDSSGSIVTTGGTFDPSTKKVVVTVSWGSLSSSQVSETLYLTRYLDNDAYVQTTQADFDAGTKSGTTVTNTLGGEVTLGVGGYGNWCEPELTIASLDLPKSGVANAVWVIEGQAFAGTGENASGVSFANINITNTNPPSASVVGTFDGYKTNAIFGEDDYAYLGTDTNNKEIVIIDLNNVVGGKYTEAGYFDAPGNGDGNGIFVSGNVGYMLSENKVYSFDLTSKSGSRPILDPDGVVITASGTKGRDIYIVGTYAYIAVSGVGSINELVIVDISNPSNLQMVGWADVNGKSGEDVYVNSTGTRAYLATNGASSYREFFIIDTTSKTGARPTVGSYESNGMSPNGVAVVTGNKAILVGVDAEEYQVIDITNESNPVRCGGLDINTSVFGVAGVLEADGDAYSYIITGDATAEFKIIEGGPGGQYAASGEFISSTFDPGFQTAFNRFDLTVERPPNTDVKFQVAVEDAIAGSCSTVGFTFVGPDGTSATFFETTQTSGATVFSYAIPGSINPGRCFRYEGFFSTTDTTATPILYDVTINYSP